MWFKVEWDDADRNPQYAEFDTEEEALEFKKVIEKIYDHVEIWVYCVWED